MKFTPVLSVSLLVGFSSGCATTPRSATLVHVNPGAQAPVAQSGRGTLMVFSAFEVRPPSPTEGDSEVRHYSDYEVKDSAGALVAKVKNRADALGESPATLALAPGQYRVTARANGFGDVEVPVAITAARLTVLHLEAGPKPTGPTTPADYDLVRISGGRVVGWGVFTAELR